MQEASGTITLTLADTSIGSRYRFSVLAAQTMIIKAPTGTTIRIGNAVTSNGGTISNNVVGATITIIAEATNTFIAESTLEVW